jgi:hypothetical protein
MAIVVRAEPPFKNLQGRIVRVVSHHITSLGRVAWTIEKQERFVLTENVRGRDGRLFRAGENRWLSEFPDEWLRPIRGEDGDDESLTWAGKPEAAAIEWALGVGRVEA